MAASHAMRERGTASVLACARASPTAYKTGTIVRLTSIEERMLKLTA